jgi:hypothetical protein
MRAFIRSAAPLALLALPLAAFAGPPFATDDPEPAPNGGYEIYLFSEGTKTRDGTEGSLPGFEVNYGAAPDLQLAVQFSQDYNHQDGSLHSRYGATELGVKYRFVHEDEDGWRPQIAFYPSVDIPHHGDDTSTLLPLWAQKSFGEWEVFGGGGRRLNPGEGTRDNWFVGVAALRQVSDHLQLGGEVFRETADSDDTRAATGFNLAALYDLSNTWHVVASAGRGISAVRDTNEFSYYVGLELTTPR